MSISDNPSCVSLCALQSTTSVHHQWLFLKSSQSSLCACPLYVSQFIQQNTTLIASKTEPYYSIAHNTMMPLHFLEQQMPQNFPKSHKAYAIQPENHLRPETTLWIRLLCCLQSLHICLLSSLYAVTIPSNVLPGFLFRLSLFQGHTLG